MKMTHILSRKIKNKPRIKKINGFYQKWRIGFGIVGVWSSKGSMITTNPRENASTKSTFDRK